MAACRQKASSENAPCPDRQKLVRTPRRKGRHDQREDCDRRAWPVRREVPGHAEHSLCDDGDSHELEAVQQSLPCRSGQRASAIGEDRQRDRRRQRESGPGGKSADIARPQEPDREARLAACRAWKELAEPQSVSEGALVEPAALDDELVAEIAEMRDRPAERREAELEKDAQDFERRAGAIARWGFSRCHQARSSGTGFGYPFGPEAHGTVTGVIDREPSRVM